MIDRHKFSWRERGKAFVYAWHGFKALVTYEHNARIHVVAACIAIVLGVMTDISRIEWALIALSIGMVISAEAMNSAVEALADRITTEYDPLIGRAKDFGATAVTVLALVALVVGGIIFIPRLLLMIG